MINMINNAEGIIFGVYFSIWLMGILSLFVACKFVKDINMKNKINKIGGYINASVFLVVINILFYIWKTPLAGTLFVNLLVIVFVIFGSKNIRYCQKCGAINQWVMFRKYCSKCGSLIME